MGMYGLWECNCAPTSLGANQPREQDVALRLEVGRHQPGRLITRHHLRVEVRNVLGQRRRVRRRVLRHPLGDLFVGVQDRCVGLHLGGFVGSK